MAIHRIVQGGFVRLLGIWVFLLAWEAPLLAARMEILRFDSRLLRNNPLHDPTVRSVAVFLPAQAAAGVRLPIIYYLPGYGGSPDQFISRSNLWLDFTQSLAERLTPMVLVVVDGRTRWGCGQYLNSPAQGNYEDYICDEIVSAVEAKYPAPTNGVRRIIAGHSSGGFGALRLGGSRHTLFDAIIALSPDSDFPVSHLRLVQIAAVSNAPLSEIERMEAGALPPPRDGDLQYAIGLSAAYAPQRDPPNGQFDWLYTRDGRFREEIWRRWLDNDPLTIVRSNRHAFEFSQAIYLDGAAQDEYLANLGARAIFEALRADADVARCEFYEPPGHHGDHLRERLLRGAAWVFGKPMQDVR